jgi:hypothetical protein
MDPKNQGRTGQVLHPSQHRVLSVLEAQRAQVSLFFCEKTSSLR